MHLIVHGRLVREVVRVLRRSARAAKVQDPAKDQNQQEGQSLLKQMQSWVGLLRAALLLLLVEASVAEVISPCVAWSAEEDVAPAEEGLEDIVRVELLLVEVIPLLEVLLCAMLIIDALFLRIVQASERCAYLLEGIRGVWSSVLVRVKLKRKLLVGTLDLVL